MKNDAVKLAERLSKLDGKMIELDELVKNIRIEICHLFWQTVGNRKRKDANERNESNVGKS
ncbi:MAG: hypothetical protein ACD_37C00483G0001 [uncultured bacterium]|nr:MAG: hypothetical protein ACD_37C00483G0001 [uncultured bacterium]KKQ37273.1 MAG: hypothetical protein US55_C0036G0008 [Candidatus Levybacteria bacterium GW2011_GWC2_37_7]KKQ40871.1 MAG: hypothetical protein US59_C0045G0006 [Candidatus Levybacteria bacterium GW2011_GWB1_37_8]